MPPPVASDILNISQYILFTLHIPPHQPSSPLNSISLVTFAILRYCFHYRNSRIMPKMLRSIFFLLLALFAGCQRGTYYVAHKAAIAEAAMVVTPHPLASAVGLKILKQGGNAVDAAVAVQWAMAVVYPRAGNIGGGGFMLIRRANGEAASLDYREKAPALASRDMYLDAQGNAVEGLSINGHLASGVPGAVAGLFEAHARHGKLPMAKLMNPAIELAQKGFAISHGEAERLNAYQADFRKYNEAPNPFFKDKWQAGDLLVQSELARTLQLIRDNGPEGFYKGETAREIVAEMKSANGIISLDDLAAYQAKWRKPIIGQYKQYRILSMPPPSSGGVALVQMLDMLEPYPIAQWGFHSPKTVHTMAEAMRRAYADRAKHLGDSDFYTVPVDSLLAASYLQQRMAGFSPDSATLSQSILAGQFKLTLESFETEHTSIVDQEGNAVSVTTTLNSNYGSKVWVSGAGFFLNNEMDDFSVKPGVPNQFGLVGAEANAVAPGKRMLSSMTPTIVEKDGKLFMVLGAPGGSTIITGVLQVFLNVVEFGLPLDQAVSAGRFHHQWLPDQILMENNALSESTTAALTAKGHRFQTAKAIAVVKAIVRLPDGRLHGAADPRNPDDDARGY